MTSVSERISVTTLVQKLPRQWWGLFGAFRAPQYPLETAEVWHSVEGRSRYGQLLSWPSLLQGLSTLEPLESAKQLTFVPLFILLPEDLQRALLSFLLQHRHDIPLKPLQEFIDVTQPYCSQESWCGVLLRIVSSYILVQKQTSAVPELKSLHNFSTTTNDLATALSERLKADTNSTIWHDHTLHYQIQGHVTESQVFSDMFDKEMEVGEQLSGPASNKSAENSMEIVESIDSPPITEELSQEKPVGAADYAVSTANGDLELDEEMQMKVQKLRDVWLNNADSRPPEELDLLMAAPSHIEAICGKLDFCSLPMTAVAVACAHLATIADVISYGNTVQFMRSAIFPKVCDQTQNVSRTLTDAVNPLADKFPKQLVDGVFVPCCVQGLEASQAELMCLVTKEAFNSGSKLYLLQKIVDNCQAMEENLIAVLQTLLNSQLDLDEISLTKILLFLKNSSQALEKNINFGKLLLAFVNKYGKQMTEENRFIMSCILDSHNTFLKKTVETAMKKFKPK